MKALKLQSCAATKSSKRIYSNRAAYKRASLVLAPFEAFSALLLCLIPMVAASTSESAAGYSHPIFHARTLITDGIVADFPFHGYLYLPGGVPAVGGTVWVVNDAQKVSALQNTYKSVSHDIRCYQRFIFCDPFFESLRIVAMQLATLSDANPINRVGFALSFVQSLRHDDDNHHYQRFAVETLIDGAGECYETAVLFGGIVNALGFE